MILAQDNIYFSTKGPELEGGVGEFLKVLDHLCPDGIAIDIPDAGEIIRVGIDDAGSIPIFPEVSGSLDEFVVADRDPGVEVLHGTVEVFFSGGGDDMVVVGHEDDMMDEEVVFLVCFLDGVKDDAGDLSLIEAERSIVGPTDQVVGVICLDDSQGTSHALGVARSLPLLPFTPHKVL